MKVEAIALPYYGIGDFLTHLPFICALAKKNKESKFIILTKSRTFAKELLSFEKRIEVFYIENDHTIFSSIKEFFRLKDIFKKKKVSRIYILYQFRMDFVLVIGSKVKFLITIKILCVTIFLFIMNIIWV